MLQRIKDFAIATGMEPWARPLWAKLTGAALDPYDETVRNFIRSVLQPDSICVDIGCHKGLILDFMIERCTHGRFYAFEPIPYLCSMLRRKYRQHPAVHVHQLALYSTNGKSTFHIDVGSPGLSALQWRAGSTRHVKRIEVETARLDDVLLGVSPHFLKIDVEGAELHVLEGARRLLSQTRPFVIFEHSMAGTSCFGTSPDAIFDLFAECGLRLSLIDSFLEGRSVLDRDGFRHQHDAELSIYFLAHP